MKSSKECGRNNRRLKVKSNQREKRREGELEVMKDESTVHPLPRIIYATIAKRCQTVSEAITEVYG